MHSKLREISYAEIVSDPNKFGAPTFEQFCRNPRRWMGDTDDLLDTADRGSSKFTNVTKHIYEFEGIRCATPTEVEKVAKDMGKDLREYELKVEAIPLPGQMCEMLVRVTRKESFLLRGIR